jgi:hypothetical protein
MREILICLLVMLVLQLATPFWWWVMVVPFVAGAAAGRSAGKALRTGFLSAGILWLGAGFYYYLTGSGLIATRMAAMLGIGDPILLIVATGLVAGFAAGLAGYAGYAVGQLVRAPAKKERS